MRPQSASLVFKGGGVVLSTQTAYDRQLLVDYVRDCAYTNEGVRLMFGHVTWRVRCLGNNQRRCSRCHRLMHDVECYGSFRRKAECVGCALLDSLRLVALPAR